MLSLKSCDQRATKNVYPVRIETGGRDRSVVEYIHDEIRNWWMDPTSEGNAIKVQNYSWAGIAQWLERRTRD